jgi:(R)-2-hydroxyglutarate---pyruvate transhydrogenase
MLVNGSCPLTTMLSRHLARRIALRSTTRAVRLAHTLRDAQLNTVNEQDIEHFSSILPKASVLSTLAPVSTSSSELEIYNTDWMNKYHGKSSTVLRPRTTQEVSKIVKWCNERRIGIVPQGGNTGLVGGSVPVNDELVLSLGNMNNIRSFDPVSGEWPLRYHYAYVLNCVARRNFGCRRRMHSRGIV